VKSKKSTTLASFIFEDMASQIETTGAVSCKLTLSALAAHYDVSLSPVRTAVERLVKGGYLSTSETGRLALGSPKRRRKKSPRRSVFARINYEEVIRSDVIGMSLKGRDGFLREQWATERYGIGRTVLRPIFSQLAGQGIIERLPRRGWRIRPFDKEDLCSFIEIRELLEIHALQLARPRLREEELVELLESNQIEKRDSKFQLNNRLHDYWIGLSENHYIQKFFRRDAVYYRTLFDYATPEAHLVKEMAAQHCAILEALLEKKWSTAEKALREHIRAQKPIVKLLVEKLKESGE
jgi:DNA-binding GntR family transcriptional regulator